MSSMNRKNPRQGPSRRDFLKTSGGAAFSLAALPWLPLVEFSKRPLAPASRDVLVHIFLRGGADALCLFPPYGDPNYYLVRSANAVPTPSSGGPNAAVDLDGYFGMHPALAPLLPAYQAGHLAVVQAVGIPNPSRSHFERERMVEYGDNAGTIGSGWIARHLASLPPLNPTAPLRGLGVRTDLPYALAQAPSTLPIPDPANSGLYGQVSSQAARLAFLSATYNREEPDLAAKAQSTFATLAMLGAINFAGYVPAGGAVYPSVGSYASFGQGLRAAAALIKAQVGVETIALDLGDWDTHGTQGTFGGTFHGLATALAQGLSAFYTDVIANGGPNVTVVVVSEFGRRVLENANSGTDHGHGGMMMVLGQNVAGGQVITQWPGLAPNQLFEGLDLATTIDCRDILAEILADRLANPATAIVFPGFAPTFRNVTN